MSQSNRKGTKFDGTPDILYGAVKGKERGSFPITRLDNRETTLFMQDITGQHITTIPSITIVNTRQYKSTQDKCFIWVLFILYNPNPYPFLTHLT